ncbi:hypothetical protein J41TS12_05840 [Paenibacillus antibioticophila]|uniref:site-specific DNA-methyltransferase (adenine-specific) n=1 Tax=Paenibacillus antibioticophila TaxID=1274374 RepID=A0A919XQK3_9BACL|nr:hypothetical protein [Paenibacillus antibioticophila]GIO35723.1 hypothetical protein J41TS12_05840 [Paenibacillus antibioticophila]
MYKIKFIKVFKTIGGKSRLLKKMLPILRFVFRRMGVRGYLDLFGGGNKFIPQIYGFPLAHRVYNEFDTGIANLMSCLADWGKTREMIRLTYRLQFSIQSQEDFDKANEVRRRSETPQTKSAALTIIVAEFSRAADRKNFCKLNAEKGISYKSLIRYTELVPIMRNVIVTNNSYELYFEKYGHRNDFLCLLDPPYVDSDIYLDGFTRQMHIDMARRIVSTQMKVILCGTDDKGIYDYLIENGWYKYCLGKIPKSSAGKHGEEQEEFIWTNFPIPSYLLPRQCR